jgi:hypothetical protein
MVYASLNVTERELAASSLMQRSGIVSANNGMDGLQFFLTLYIPEGVHHWLSSGGPLPFRLAFVAKVRRSQG